MISSNPHRELFFSDLPLFIQKDRFENGNVTAIVSKTDSFMTAGKSILKAITSATDTEYTFSPYHYHDGLELLRIDEGSATVVVNNRSIAVEKGDILLFNAFEAHGIFLLNDTESFARTSLAFRPHYFFPPERSDGEFHFFADLKSLVFENHIPSTHPVASLLSEETDHIISLYEKNENGWAIEAFSRIVLLYSHPVRFHLYRDCDTDSSYMFDFMNRVSSYIEENLAEDITTADVAAYCQYSTEHFCRLFKKCFNKTFKEYLNVYRIRRAKEFIDCGDFSTIAEVSSRFGFNNQNHFGHMFKKYVGILPSEYINRHRTKK